ncbi:MAG: hypothetical protein NTW12_08300 [Deltaproteobacteria bacterium]|nr:hypothetical protein [Deltaproteobacteria bacterium]
MEGISFLMAGTLSVTLFENSDISFKVDELVKSQKPCHSRGGGSPDTALAQAENHEIITGFPLSRE